MSIVAPIVNIVKLQCGVDVVRSSPDVLEPVYTGMALSPVEICDPTNLCTALNVLLSVLALGRFRQLLVFGAKLQATLGPSCRLLLGPSCRLPTASPGRWIGGRPPDMVASCDLSG